MSLCPSFSASTFHSAGKDEEACDRPAGGQLGAAEVHGQREPPARHRVAEGQSAAGGGRRRERREEEEMDAEFEEPDPGAQRQIHLPRLQPGRRDQRHLQSGSHTWVHHDLCASFNGSVH